MSNIIPFQFEKHDIRVIADDQGGPMFVGKDLCIALGYADPTTAIRSHCRGVQKLHPIPDSLGRMQEVRVLTEGDMFRLIVNSTLPSAERFERLVFDEILPAIRKTGSYGAPKAAAVAETIDAAKLFQPCFRIARLIGCDKQAAAISANQAVQAITGTNVLKLLGQTHIAADNQDALYFTPTELGKRIGTSARGMNLLLAEAGFQMKRSDAWEVTEAGKDFARIYDTGKKHGSGVPIQQIKWAANVLTVLGQGEDA